MEEEGEIEATMLRMVAERLAARGMIAILRGGVPVAEPETMRGIYRLGMPRKGRDESG